MGKIRAKIVRGSAGTKSSCSSLKPAPAVPEQVEILESSLLDAIPIH